MTPTATTVAATAATNGHVDHTTNLISLADVQRREVVWLDHGTIPCGMLSILGGRPGLGKSLWMLKLAARIAELGRDVIICSAEDSLEYSIRPRLQALQADTSRIHALVPEDKDGNPRGVSFPSDATVLLTRSAKSKRYSRSSTRSPPNSTPPSTHTKTPASDRP